MTTLKTTIDDARAVMPDSLDHLWNWVYQFTGVRVPRRSICQGHTAPFDLFARQVLDRPSLALWHGPRGSGKSFLSAIDTHIASRFHPRHATRILGGSLAQSEQIYQALSEVIRDGEGPLGSDRDTLSSLAKREAKYRNGSHVSILAASSTSVRGPHVPSLKLDEVDEIEPDIREAAMGMAMEVRGNRSSVLMTSTWHRVGGPMAELIERGRSGAFPVDTYCVFEVLERCPESRSGPNLEFCKECPIVKWCHQDRDKHPSGLPKAKRSRGHYTIDSLIQKAQAVSSRVFESDYLCLGPKASGLWFTSFDPAKHVTDRAEYDRRLPVHVSIDCGVYTGAVWLQTRPSLDGSINFVNVFADYLAEGQAAQQNATAIMRVTEQRCGIGMASMRVSMDPAANHRNSVGPIVKGEYERVGCQGRNGLESWPTMGAHRPKADSLTLVEALLLAADGKVRLTIHPRCRHLIQAFQTYRRAKKNGALLDHPEAECHPEEDLIDPLAGALILEFPEGRRPKPQFRQVPGSHLH